MSGLSGHRRSAPLVQGVADRRRRPRALRVRADAADGDTLLLGQPRYAQSLDRGSSERIIGSARVGGDRE